MKKNQQFLFEPPTPAAKASGKTIDALEYSRDKREEILDMFGGKIPLSVIDASKGRPEEEDRMAFGSYDESSSVKDKTKHLAKTFAVSGRGAAGGALSVFPQNILRTVVLLYSEVGDTILDPFAGHNSRMEGSIKLSRNYIGFDVSKRFMEFNRSRLAEISNEFYGKAELHLHDSRRLGEVYDGSADFCVTSPPYYDIEIYGDEAEQLGKAETYNDFMDSMQKVMMQVYLHLKSGAFVAWFINDFRRKDVFIPYHADSQRRLIEVGFVPWDMIIVNLGWTMRAAFATQVLSQKILPKVHEYGLIMRKP